MMSKWLGEIMGRVYPKGIGASISVGLILVLGSCTKCGVSNSEIVSRGKSTYQIVTGEDAEQDRTQWDALYDRDSYVYGKEPAEILKRFIEVLPVGRALDIAMGEGRNAVFLAKKGFIVDGVDLSEVAIRKAKRLAKENGVTIQTTNADLNNYRIRPDSYEVIINIQYLQRSLIPQIKKGLKRGGVVVFENQTVEQMNLPGSQGLKREYLLGKGELRELFKEFQILHYEEKVTGDQAVAYIVAMKP